MLRKFGYYAFVAVFIASGVEVHARYFLVGKHLVDFVLHAFGAVAHNLDGGLAAGRADVGQSDGITAVVAREGANVLVIGERHVAILAFRHPSALFALHHRSIASAILKENHLLLVVEGVSALAHEFGGEHAVHFLFATSLFGVDNLHLGQLKSFVACEQRHESESAATSFVECLNRGRGRAEQSFCAVHRCYDYCRIAPVVAWRGVLLLVAGVVLFVHYHHAEVAERQVHSRANAYHHHRFGACEQAFPDVDALIVAEFAVIDEQTVAEHLLQPLGELGGKGYFGHQIQRLTALVERLLNEMNID